MRKVYLCRDVSASTLIHEDHAHLSQGCAMRQHIPYSTRSTDDEKKEDDPFVPSSDSQCDAD